MRRRRVSVVFVVAMLGFLVVQLRLVALQVGQTDTWRWEARRTATRFTSLPFERGWILDRNGEPLARTEEVRDLTFRFRDWRRGTAVGQAAAAAWSLDGRRRGLREAYDRFDELLNGLLALPVVVFDPAQGDPPALEPGQARRDLAWYLGELLGDELGAALSAGLDEGEWRGARTLGELPGAQAGAAAAAARAADERRALYDLAYQSGATPHALMAALDVAVAFVDERVERIAARQEREEAAAAARAAASGPLAQPEPSTHPFLRRRALHAEFDNDTALALSPVPYDTQTLVALRAGLLAGFDVHSERRRTWPEDAADHAPLILGNVGQPSPADVEEAERNRLRLADLASLEQLTPEELAEFEALRVRVREIDYTYSEERGRLGLERALEGVLRGKRGYVAVAPGEGGEGAAGVQAGVQAEAEIERVPPRRGLNVTLTLDLRLQQAAEAVLDRALAGLEVGGARRPGAPGAIVLLDPRSGQVRALATSPRPTRAELATRYGELLSAPLAPLAQRALAPGATGNLPPPGSTFKPAVALAGLAHGLIAPGETLHCAKRIEVGTQTLSCLGTHGDLDLDEALARSCNQYFYALADRVGGERLLTYTARLGFGRSTSMLRGNEVLASFGIPVDGGVSESFVALPERRLARVETMRLGIGQAPLDDVTPLQVAVMMGAIGHGVLRPPSLIASVEAFGALPPRAAVELGVRAADLAAVRRGLEATLDRGTADHVDRRALERLGIDVAGKTGTPEVQGLPDHSWFAGYLPRRDPVLAFAIYLEHTGEHGGDAGVPLFNQLLDEPGFAACLRQEVLP